MNLKPLYDRIVVKPIQTEDITKGGIIIPETAKEKPMKGKVIAVGEGTQTEAGNIISLQVKAGDEILYGKWGGTEVRVDGEDYLIMKESDVFCIIKN